jgi:hypothetical protein
VLSIANRQTVVIGGLRQRGDVGKYNGITYLKDLNLVGRLFRSHDTTVQESELVVFISPEIISYSDDPTCRQKIAAETIRCRLDQVPEAEGCPPCCRRLPIGATEGILPEPATSAPTPAGGEQVPPPNAQSEPSDSASANQRYLVEPLSAVRITSSEMQFGAAGRSEQTRELVSDGRLRRLPVVAPIETRVVVAPSVGKGIFAAPPAANSSPTPIDSNQIRTAERDASNSIWR